MNKQILIATAKGIIAHRGKTNTFSCEKFNCGECPASSVYNQTPCISSKRFRNEWLQNWLKENETTIDNTDVVISRELLDEVIKSLNIHNAYENSDLIDKLIKFRGEK